MSKSLQEQLLQAGLANQQQAKKINKEKHKQKKQERKNGAEFVDEAKVIAQEARKQQAERDRELNRQQQQQASLKAIGAQIKQLIESNALKKYAGEIEYKFADQGLIKTIRVEPLIQRQLAKGRISIARLETKYYLIANEVADKIQQRDASYIVLGKPVEQEISQAQDDDDDFYAEFQIPDDLMW